jgi:hypothetical protein
MALSGLTSVYFVDQLPTRIAALKVLFDHREQSFAFSQSTAA